MRNDPEYTHTWDDHCRYLYDERVAILTGGHQVPVTANIDAIARRQARLEHVAIASARAAQDLTTHPLRAAA